MNKQGQEKLKAEIEQNGYAIRNTKLPRKLKKKLKKNRQMPVLTIYKRNLSRLFRSVFTITLDKEDLKNEN